MAEHDKDRQQEDRVELVAGMPVGLQVPNGQRLTGQVLGFVPSQYLVLRSAGKQGFDGHRVLADDLVVVRYLYEGAIYGFRSYVLHSVSKPEPLLFLSYPASSVHRHPLRQAERLHCSLPVKVVIAGHRQVALLVDLSETGCQCIVPESEALGAEAPDQQIEIEFMDPVHGHPFKLAGIIRRRDGDSGRVRLGIEFLQPQQALFGATATLLRLAS